VKNVNLFIRFFMAQFVIGCFLVGWPAAGMAAIHPPTAMTVSASPAEQTESQPDYFFKALAPKPSSKGAVRSFTVRVVTRRPVKPAKDAPLQVVKLGVIRGNGTLAYPVSGRMTSVFGYRPHPSRRRRHFHTGIDLSAPTGTPIAAAADGVVIFSGWGRGYGKTVEIEHPNGLVTLYAHCSELLTRVGTRVKTGTVIGRVGRTGVTTGPHLHFEVKKGKLLMNPLSYLGR
jgi:murein DD-endopeptidase MepM/ murein hydrolase activator NlpD